MPYLKQIATVKELKELIKDLPDNTLVLTSEKYGRGGLMQGYDECFFIPLADEYYSLDDDSMEEALDTIDETIKLRKKQYDERIECIKQNKNITEPHRKALLDSEVIYFNSDMNELLKVKKQIQTNIKVDKSERKNNSIELSCAY